MSAYDWKKCPLCQNKKVNLQKKLKEERKTLSDDKYEELLDELEEMKEADEESTSQVRQDQEIWLNEEGFLCGYVSMSCQACSKGEWNIEFKVKQGKKEIIGGGYK